MLAVEGSGCRIWSPGGDSYACADLGSAKGCGGTACALLRTMTRPTGLLFAVCLSAAGCGASSDSGNTAQTSAGAGGAAAGGAGVGGAAGNASAGSAGALVAGGSAGSGVGGSGGAGVGGKGGGAAGASAGAAGATAGAPGTGGSSSGAGGAGAGGANAGAGGSGGAALCPAATDGCIACFDAIDACAAVEACVGKPACAPAWDGFVACEKAGLSFSKCLDMLSSASGDLVLKGAAFCDKACAGPDPSCDQQPASACFECCKNAHKSAYSGFQLVYYDCACQSADCNDSEVCASSKPLTPACVKYLEQEEYMPTTDTCSQAQAQCMGSSCQPFVACMLNCPTG